MVSKENPLFAPDDRLFQVRKITEELHAHKGPGKHLFQEIKSVFDPESKEKAFPILVTECINEQGLTWHNLHPEYASHLAGLMHMISLVINAYLNAAQNPKRFSFGKSSLYNMEFEELLY